MTCDYSVSPKFVSSAAGASDFAGTSDLLDEVANCPQLRSCNPGGTGNCIRRTHVRFLDELKEESESIRQSIPMGQLACRV